MGASFNPRFVLDVIALNKLFISRDDDGMSLAYDLAKY
jgi:hypothetical protein